MRLPSVLILSMMLLNSCNLPSQDKNAELQPPGGTLEHPVSSKPCLNLNTATAEELMPLPGVGEVMARRIIEYRKQHGPFRRPQEIIIIDGFSEKKYRAIADEVCVE